MRSRNLRYTEKPQADINQRQRQDSSRNTAGHRETFRYLTEDTVGAGHETNSYCKSHTHTSTQTHTETEQVVNKVFMAI